MSYCEGCEHVSKRKIPVSIEEIKNSPVDSELRMYGAKYEYTCRRNPPFVIGANGESIFPKVDKDDWCGCYEQRR